MPVVRVELPYHLRNLARVGVEISVTIEGDVTAQSLIEAIERDYPMLVGTIRHQVTGMRRPLVRFFACQRDLSHEPMDAALPSAVVSGQEPFLVVGSVAGG